MLKNSLRCKATITLNPPLYHYVTLRFLIDTSSRSGRMKLALVSSNSRKQAVGNHKRKCMPHTRHNAMHTRLQALDAELGS